MPKLDIDYSNTIIYKIVCKDLSIKELYVGHTTNFVQRKYAHKQGCINLKTPDYNTKLYKTIRECGGWNNWEMTIVNFYNCKSHLEAREKEQEHFISLGATLNSVHPLPIKIMPEKVLTDISNNDTLVSINLNQVLSNKILNNPIITSFRTPNNNILSLPDIDDIITTNNSIQNIYNKKLINHIINQIIKQ
jgi:pectate lyase